MKVPKKKYTSADLIAMMHAKFSGRDYAVLEQIPNGTGRCCSSWIDAAVVSLWPSNGLYWSAYEIKVDRGDFIRELQKESKNAWCRTAFHEFWYVAPSEVVKEQELPEGVGLLIPRGGGLTIIRHAARRENIKIDHSIICAFARGMMKQIAAEKKSAAEQIKTTDPDCVRNQMYRDIVDAFLKSRRSDWYGAHEASQLQEALQIATSDKRADAERDQILSRLEVFQRRMLELFQQFIELAYAGLLERDDAGKFVVERWGGKESLNLMLARAKSKRGIRHHDATIVDAKKGLYELARAEVQLNA